MYVPIELFSSLNQMKWDRGSVSNVTLIEQNNVVRSPKQGGIKILHCLWQKVAIWKETITKSIFCLL